MNDSKINIHDLKVSDELLLLGRNTLLDYLYEQASQETIARIQSDASMKASQLLDKGILDYVDVKCFIESNSIKLAFEFVESGARKGKETVVASVDC